MAQKKRRALLGRKLGMTQIFLEKGELVPVTVLEVGPCRVLQVKTPEKDGYSALKVGFHETKKKATNAMAGVFGKASCGTMRHVREVPALADQEVNAGDDLKVDVFNEIESVDVFGITKGRGFSGTIRRWNFHSGPRSHGCKNVREIGSVGPAFPGRVIPGKPMPGQYGNQQRKVINLRVVKVDAERNLLVVRGAVPGPTGGFVFVQASEHKAKPLVKQLLSDEDQKK